MKVKEKYKEYLKMQRGIDDYNAFKKILYSPKDTLIEYLYNNYIKNLSLPREISICDIGGGDGRRILDIVSRINQQFNCIIHLDFIEQSGLMCDQFRAYTHRVNEFCNTCIYTNEAEQVVFKNDYHIIFLIHSIFCFPNFSVFREIWSRVKEGGVLYVVANSSESILAKLKRELDGHYEDKRYEIHDLCSNLDVNNINYTKSYIETSWAADYETVDNALAVIFEWLSLGNFNSLDYFRQTQLIQQAKQLANRIGTMFFFSETEEVLVLKKSNK